MIPLNEAIETGAWLQPTYNEAVETKPWILDTTDNIYFRIKLTGFSKIDFIAFDKAIYFEYNVVNFETENIWLLEFDLISLQKEESNFRLFRDAIKLCDEEGYVFSFKNTSALLCNTKFAIEFGFHDLEFDSINPKVRKPCKALIELPDDFDQLFLTVKNGKISEA